MTRWLGLLSLAVATAVLLLIVTKDGPGGDTDTEHIALFLGGAALGAVLGAVAALEWVGRRLR